MPKLNDHVYCLNGVLYDNKRDADLFKRQKSTNYVPDKQFGYNVGLGWAVNSVHRTQFTKNCVMRKIRTYPLCPHITCTNMRSAKLDYIILEATRVILGGEEILRSYNNLYGNVSRQASSINNMSFTCPFFYICVGRLSSLQGVGPFK